jgi:hypothetical protein
LSLIDSQSPTPFPILPSFCVCLNGAPIPKKNTKQDKHYTKEPIENYFKKTNQEMERAPAQTSNQYQHSNDDATLEINFEKPKYPNYAQLEVILIYTVT